MRRQRFAGDSLSFACRARRREHVARGVAREHFCAALKETLAAAHSRTNYAQNVVRARARGERAGAQVKCIKYWGTNVSGMHAWLGGNMNERRMGFCGCKRFIEWNRVSFYVKRAEWWKKEFLAKRRFFFEYF